MFDNGIQSSLNNDVQLFAVIGAQRTGTNLLREILNTNDQIAMLGEVLSPSPAPAHWDNFCRGLRARSTQPNSFEEAENCSIDTLNLCAIAFTIIGKAIGKVAVMPSASTLNTIN